MEGEHQKQLSLLEGRFSRLESIEWWDQRLLEKARILIIGAGALGNEVIKNLSLLGIGNIIIVDMDSIEASNLSRSVLFRSDDEGKSKAECAAREARSIYPDINALHITGNVLADVGLGFFRWADIIIGALDNREARVFVNSSCARLGRPWVDGGIDVFQGIVRGFAPPSTACYECTMSSVDWDMLNKRRSCSLLARRAVAQRGTPTTPTIASIVGGIQVQEVVKLLHGMEALIGRGYVFEGMFYNSYTVNYPISPDCGWHDDPPPVERVPEFTSGSSLSDVWAWASDRMGGIDSIELGRELIKNLECARCGISKPVFLPPDNISEEMAMCEKCGTEYAAIPLHSFPQDYSSCERSIAELGLPRWEIIWARKGFEYLGIEISGDAPIS